MHYIVNGGQTYDGAPEFLADGALKLPTGQVLAEGAGWTKVSVLPGAPTSARKTVSDRAKDLANRRRRNLSER